MGKSRITPEQRALRTKLGEMMAGAASADTGLNKRDGIGQFWVHGVYN